MNIKMFGGQRLKDVRTLIFGAVLAIFVVGIGKVALESMADRRAVEYVRNRSGLILPGDIKIIVRDEKSSIIPSDGYGTWVIELPDRPELTALNRCSDPRYTLGILADAGIVIVPLDRYVESKRFPVCYRLMLSADSDAFEIFVVQDRKLVYFYRY